METLEISISELSFFNNIEILVFEVPRNNEYTQRNIFLLTEITRVEKGSYYLFRKSLLLFHLL